MNYLDELNSAQRAAVEYCDGPSLVIAGAGSGKTRVLTYKIVHLLNLGMAPWAILALTFTNKAAGEMKERIAQLVGKESSGRIWMGTFHSIFARILRIECQRLGFTSNFTIYDAADSKSLVKSIINEMKLDDKVYKPSTVLAHISAAKNRLILPDAYAQNADIARADAASKIPATSKIYSVYWNRCRQADAMDFDDILLYTFLLFQNYPEVKEHYEQRFEYVLVDEYQDTNYAQHAIIWQLTQRRQRVCVVGDDAQSIYSFRGANIDNILTFNKLYQNAKLFKLEQNYRSTQTIVQAANSLILKNQGQIKKQVFSEKEKGQPIHIYQFYSDLEEAAGVTKRLLGLHHNDHIGWEEMAIFYRTNAQSRSLEEALRKQGVPYRIYGGQSFYQRKEIKDLIAYFRLAVNPHDEEALKRVINYPARGIGQTSLSKYIEAAQRDSVSIWDAISNPQLHNVAVSTRTANKVGEFVLMIENFRQSIDKEDAASLGKRIATESGVVADVFRGRDATDLARQENVQELLDGIQQFVDNQTEEGNDYCLMPHFLQEVSLISTLEESEDDDENKLSLMTVHSSKGLEFRVVFIVGMEENLFPNQMAHSSIREMEEERRLLYVAVTRAKEQCYMSYALNRYRYGKSEFCEPSSFLRDFDRQYLKFDGSVQSLSHSRQTPRTSDPFISSFSSPISTSYRQSPTSVTSQSRITESSPVRPMFRSVSSINPQPTQSRPETPSTSSNSVNAAGELHIGSRIEHSRFGIGEVIAMSGSGIDAKATVKFENVGTKQLLLRFAKFSII
ncbi:MAG: exodeoxyribonuclease V subunit gamma [Bacteroidaceae bacterium]|nr:exodeoxyribonuclease V subunit gamma [Bacteroidaceae bacterium]